MDWRKVDILVTTPTQLGVVLKVQNVTEATKPMPKFVVLDEFDQMLVDKKYTRNIEEFLNSFGSRTPQNKMTEDLLERKVSTF